MSWWECGFEGGDCEDFDIKEWYPNCIVPDPREIRNGICDGGFSNTEKCGFDGGDCVEFNAKYPNCKVARPYWIGDGICNGVRYNTEACGFDGGDCPKVVYVPKVVYEAP